MLVVNESISIPLAHLEFSFARSSGPGGQNVNKVNSKATVHWDVARSDTVPEDVRRRLAERYHRRMNKQGQLVVSSQRFRDQGRNVADCLEKLRQLVLDVAAPPTARKKTRPSAGARRRRIDDKKRKSQKKESRRTRDWS